MAEKDAVVRLCLHIAQMTLSGDAVKQCAAKSKDMYGLCEILSDDECKLGMKMKIRRNYFPKQLAAKTGFSKEYVQKMLDLKADTQYIPEPLLRKGDSNPWP